MRKLLQHKGFFGSAEVSLEDNCLSGKLLFLDDLVTYEAQTVEELFTQFRVSVEDYIDMCKTLGREVKKPFSGSFNVRLGEELHQKIAIYATSQGSSINDVMKQAVTEYLGTKKQDVEIHKHYHLHTLNIEAGNISYEYELPGEEVLWHQGNTEIKVH